MNLILYFIRPAAPRAPPRSVRVIALNSMAIEITWLPPPENTLFGAIRFYTVNGTEAVTMDSTYYQEVNTTKAVFSGLHPNYVYSFSVAAVATDPGPLSEAVSNYTREDGKMNQTDNVPFQSLATYYTNYTLAIFHKVEDFSSFSLSCMYLRDKFSNFCVTIAPSGPPRIITVWAVTSTSIQVSWLPPLEEDQNGHIIGYKLLLNSTSDSLDRTYILHDSENLTMLIPGKARLNQLTVVAMHVTDETS